MKLAIPFPYPSSRQPQGYGQPEEDEVEACWCLQLAGSLPPWEEELVRGKSEKWMTVPLEREREREQEQEQVLELVLELVLEQVPMSRQGPEVHRLFGIVGVSTYEVEEDEEREAS
jgi:hypothetical protein